MLAAGTRLGRYQLERLLGRGGMGEVWAAHDPELDRKVALKVMRGVLAHSEEAQARFQREGRAMARLKHPNVITVHDASFSDGQALLAMELVDGESLHAWLATPRPPSEIVRVLVAAGRGLAAAHAAGMVHRDFKPHNVLLDRDGRVLVTDFGVARAVGDPVVPVRPAEKVATPDAFEATAAPGSVALEQTVEETAASGARSEPRDDLATPLTQTGALLGTPAYMAPEQLAGRSVDARADQFAFCVTAWEAFTGQRPFRGATLDEIEAAFERPVEVDSRIPARLRSVLLRGLARDPAARWPSMPELLSALERAWRRPRRLAIVAGSVFALAGAAIAVVATRPGTPPLAGCGDPAVALASAWSPAIRADVAAIVGPERQGVVRFFDRWAAEWTTAQRTNCSRPEDPDFVARSACLDAVRDELALGMELRTKVTPDVFAVPDLPRLYPRPEACVVDPRGVAPGPPSLAQREEVLGIRVALATTRVQIITKQPTQPLAELVTRADRSGYAPVKAEARIIAAMGRYYGGERDRAACAEMEAATASAEEAGNARLVAEALMSEFYCARSVRDDARLATILRRVDALTRRSGNPFQRAEIEGLLAREAITQGHIEEALGYLSKSKQRYMELEMTGRGDEVAALEASALYHRNLDGDLERAAQLLRDAYARSAITVDGADRLLRDIEWRLGRVEQAPRYPSAETAPKPLGANPVKIKVVDATGPVAGAQLAMSVLLVADGTRVGIEDWGQPFFATTGPDGIAEVPGGGGMIDVRANGLAGFGLTEGEPVTIKLVPPASIAGTVDGMVGIAGDPVDVSGRIARRGPGLVTIVPLAWPLGNWIAPIVRGRYALPAVLPPGRYIISAQTMSAAGDVQVQQVAVELTAGANAIPPLVFSAAPRLVQVIARTTSARVVLAFAGTSVPKTWGAVQKLVEQSPTLAIATFRTATPTDRDLEPRDAIAELGIDGSTIVCALPRTSSHTILAFPVVREGQDRDDPALVCAAVGADGRAIL